MSIFAKISSAELDDQVRTRFEDSYFEILLVNSAGTYTPGTTVDATFLLDEVTAGTGGYERQVIGYTAGDVNAYADDGIGLTTKAAVFAHDSSGNTITFNHVVQVWGSGEVLTLGSIVEPTNQVDGTYTNIPADAVSATGTGLTVDLVIASNAFSSFTINQAGYGYTAADTFQITEATLIALGATTAGSGPVTFSAATVYGPTNAGDVVSVAPTASPVVLSGGNEAVFYYNLKQFGFNS